MVTPSQAEELIYEANAPVFLMKNDDQTTHIDVSDIGNSPNH